MPRYNNSPFVLIEPGATFGIIDIVFRNMQIETGDSKENSDELEQRKLRELMKRKFTAQTMQHSIIHQLSVVDLKRLQFEYPEIYNELFSE